MKSLFAIKEGIILSHIVSKEGVRIDSERVHAIQQIGFPRNKKEVQSFLGKINFLRTFIPNFVEIMNNITDMLKKYHEIRWIVEARASFQKIKEELGDSPILFIPNYDKDFLIFYFSFENTIVLCYCKGIKKIMSFP
jgi:hypothetical protein